MNDNDNTKTAEEIDTGSPNADDQNLAAALKADDHSDILGLRLNLMFGVTGGVKKAITVVPVRKPGQQEWVRVHTDPSMHFPCAIIHLKDENEMYVVDAALQEDLVGEWAAMELHVAINKQGTTFLWPTRLAGEDGRVNPWHQSATEAVDMAKEGWVRIKANMNLGAYDIFQPMVDFADPIWPDKSMGELVAIAFKGRIIKTADHPVLKQLRGEG